MKILNIEIKARSSRNASFHEILINRNARFVGEDNQTDTYYEVSTGRLKLREGNIENSLIRYYREEEAGLKKSDVLLYKTSDPGELKAVLGSLFKVKVVVSKRRRIYFIDNVKFHLDHVKGLGDFVEIEAISKDGEFSQDQLQDQCEYYIKLFGINEEDMIAHSYSDLLLLDNNE